MRERNQLKLVIDKNFMSIYINMSRMLVELMIILIYIIHNNFNFKIK